MKGVRRGVHLFCVLSAHRKVLSIYSFILAILPSSPFKKIEVVCVLYTAAFRL